MDRWLVRVVLMLFCLLAFPYPSPAPLTYRAGEGWSYEPYGSEGKWRKKRAKDQLEAAQEAFDKGDFSTAMKAARRTVQEWPLSDYSPQAQYLLGRCFEARRLDEAAFKEYQTLVEKYPKSEHYAEVLRRQYEIAGRFLAGQWFRLASFVPFSYIPFFPSMERTAALFEKVIKNGPYSEYAPRAQLKIGEAQEKRSDYHAAVQAYEKAADRYHDQPTVAAEATYRAGMAYSRQARKADYDQGVAGQAIATLTDFLTLYPTDEKVPAAQKTISALKAEQARGSQRIAQLYERNRRWGAALIYYNDVQSKDPESELAAEARLRIEQLKQRIAQGPARK